MNSHTANVAPGEIDWEGQFNPRVAVPNFDQIMDERKRASAQIRQRRPCLSGLRYGEAERSTLDAFPAKSATATLVYIHGGYWRSGQAQDNSAIAEHFCAAGAAVFLPNYSLCPDATVPQIVDQIAQAIAWVKTAGCDYGANPDALYLCGTSAGAHLAAMLLASNSGIAGACLISGIYDLAPVLKVSVNAEIGLNEETAERMSPMVHPPAGHPRLIMAVGGLEPPLWVRQTHDYAIQCEARGLECDVLEIPDANHFSVVEALYRGSAPIAAAMTDAMRLTDHLPLDETLI